MKIRAAGASDRFHVTKPVDARLRARGVSMADVRHALAGARVCVARTDGTFGVGGVDIDGSPLSLVVSMADGDGILVLSEDER